MRLKEHICQTNMHSLDKKENIMSVEVLLSKLDKVKSTGKGRWIACCPAHNDLVPSLAITIKEGKTLVHCFSGCSVYDVLLSVNMQINDLFPDSSPRSHLKSSRMPFSYADVLRCVNFEAQLVSLAACNLFNGKALSVVDKERLQLASRRIRHALGVAGCNH